MASTPHVIFVLCLAFISSILADECGGCGSYQYCCGTCDNKYCCSNSMKILTDDCFFSRSNGDNIITISSTVVGFVIFTILIISCCVCPCCCLYKMCRKPTPVVATTTTTVMHTAYTPQPNPGQAYQGAQYPGYQPVPVQPGFGGQPMPSAPYQGQPYSPPYQGQVSGPPPPYQEARQGYSPAQVPYSQAGIHRTDL
ncbi:hypothetical protein AAFF_G00392500 [Aldrovandia affinis]|uniref:Protein shisa-5 n=1 Tax=Aldrovandia affinis TaxID=143900 RepID=A0AAD7SG97_9TELE|nr:hypothetical protein AAFF_G00392500 [Aldrovandia affinis]